MICIQCNTDKPENSFSWKNKSNGKKHRHCKDCHNKKYRDERYGLSPEYRKASIKRSKKRKKKIAKFIYRVLRCSKCIDCGNNNPVVLEFDHVRGEKLFNISEAAYRGFGLSKIKEEMRKCDIRCANCHKVKTAKDQGWYNELK